MENTKEETIIICQCGDLRHSLIIEYSEWDPKLPDGKVDKELNVSLQFVDNGFWYRFKQAWRYLFKTEKSYPYDTIMLRKKDKPKFQYILDKLDTLND